MRITYDPEKRDSTMEHRGLDMANADQVFDGPTITVEDDRKNYGEKRLITIGFLLRRMVVLVWTRRGNTRRIISMRKANDREQKTYGKSLERP